MSNILEIKNLTKSFGGVKAVNNCSFDVERGKITALIGPNGSGKSTVFNLVGGVLSPDGGKVFFENKGITNLSIQSIAKLGLSRIFQDAHLFSNLTVSDNLFLALNQNDFNFWSVARLSLESKEKVSSILKKLHIEQLIDQETRSLSFGQKRLIELARAYLKPHKLLMLDEPIAGVAPHLRVEIASFLSELRESGESILIVEHDMDFVMDLADRIVVMDAGTVIATGKPAEIKQNAKVAEAYFGTN